MTEIHNYLSVNRYWFYQVGIKFHEVKLYLLKNIFKRQLSAWIFQLISKHTPTSFGQNVILMGELNFNYSHTFMSTSNCNKLYASERGIFPRYGLTPVLQETWISYYMHWGYIGSNTLPRDLLRHVTWNFLPMSKHTNTANHWGEPHDGCSCNHRQHGRGEESAAKCFRFVPLV